MVPKILSFKQMVFLFLCYTLSYSIILGASKTASNWLNSFLFQIIQIQSEQEECILQVKFDPFCNINWPQNRYSIFNSQIQVKMLEINEALL